MEVFDLEAFFIIKTNVITGLHTITLYPNQFWFGKRLQISERQVGVNVLLIRSIHEFPGLEDDQIKTSCWIFLEKNKPRFVVVYSTNGLSNLKILTIILASNIQTDMISPRIVYQIEILGMYLCICICLVMYLCKGWICRHWHKLWHRNLLWPYEVAHVTE